MHTQPPAHVAALLLGGARVFWPRSTAAVTSAPVRSVAVLPFVDLSAARDHEYFSDGIAEELRTRLGRVPGLKVAARTSAFAFKGTETWIRCRSSPALRLVGFTTIGVPSMPPSNSASGRSTSMPISNRHGCGRVGARGRGTLSASAADAAAGGDAVEPKRRDHATYLPAYEMAKLHVALGERSEALEWLRRAYDQRSHSMVFLGVDPQLDPLRSDPVFMDLLMKTNVDKYSKVVSARRAALRHEQC